MHNFMTLLDILIAERSHHHMYHLIVYNIDRVVYLCVIQNEKWDGRNIRKIYRDDTPYLKSKGTKANASKWV